MRILLIEDNPDDVAAIQAALRGRGRPLGELESADRLSKGLERLSRGGIDIVLLDLSLPDAKGLQAFSELHARMPDIPIVILTATDGDEEALSALKSGAQDFLVKGGIAGDALMRSLRYALERRQLARLKEELFQNINHELQTPLSCIYTSLKIVMDGEAGDLNPQQRKFLEITERSTNYLLALVGDLRELTRAEAGRVSIEARPTPLPELIDEILGDLRLSAPAKNIAMTAELAEGLPQGNIDPGRFRQILVNLIVNSLKFTPKNGSITVRAEVFGADPRLLRVSVADTGPGIKPEVADLIFERLYQEREGDRRGLGLGLFISKELVNRQGGRIWVESEPGKGCVFHFTLPALQAP